MTCQAEADRIERERRETARLQLVTDVRALGASAHPRVKPDVTRATAKEIDAVYRSLLADLT